MRTMKIFVLLILAILLPSNASAERVRTAIPRATLNYLSLPVAEVKGFFRDQGLENETIVIPGTTAIAAIVSGDVDYSGAGGSGMRAALRGAPIKAVMFQTEKVTWYLLAAADIQKITDLKGKRVPMGFSAMRTIDNLVRAILATGGLTEKDVVPVMVPNVIRDADDFASGASDVLFFAFGAPKVREVDATVGGKLSVFPKVDYDGLF